MSKGATKVILAAIDGSDGATAALEQAAEAASADGAQLVVLSVMPRGILPVPVADGLREFACVERLAGGEAEASSFATEDILKEARETISHCRGTAEPVYLSRAGNPAEEILACAAAWSADVLYLGSRGLSRLETLLLGSVSKKVAQVATCPVVVVSKEGLTARRDSSSGAAFAALF